MRSSKDSSQYWSLTIVTVAICLALPFSRTPQREATPNPVAGYTRPAGTLPYFGFDSPASTDKLRDLGANTVIIGPLWTESQQQFEQTMQKLKSEGLRVIVQVTDTHDWLAGRAFVTKKAGRLLAQARNQGVGQLADMILIEGDAVGFASQLERQQAYRLAKEYFPNTPVVRRYEQSIIWAESLHGKTHPMGGTWDDYRFGPDECDVALVGASRGVGEGKAGVKINEALEQLNQLVALIKSRQPEVAVLVAAQFGDAKALETRRDAMWSAKEIEQFISAILTSPEVDGLLFRGLGSYRYDLAHHDFAAQRLAFKQSAPVTQSTRGIASER